MADVLEALGSSAFDFGLGVAGMGIQNMFARSNARLANQMAQQNQVMAPVNYVSGLRQAGLPVSLALKGAFQTAAAPGASQPSLPAMNGIGSNILAMDEARNLQTQNKLLDEQVSKTEQERIAIERENERNADEDFTLDAHLREWLRNEAKNGSPYADLYYALADSPDLFTLGTLKGINNFNAYLMQLDDYKLKLLSNEFFKRVKESELNNGIADIVATVPQRDRVKFFADLSKVYTEISRLLVDTDLDKAKIQETFANIKKIEGDTENAYYSNFTRMVRNKDYLSAGLNLFQSTLNAFAGAFGAGAGLGAGARVLGGSKAIPKGSQRGPSNPFPHPEGYRRY